MTRHGRNMVISSKKLNFPLSILKENLSSCISYNSMSKTLRGWRSLTKLQKTINHLIFQQVDCRNIYNMFKRLANLQECEFNDERLDCCLLCFVCNKTVCDFAARFMHASRFLLPISQLYSVTVTQFLPSSSFFALF